MKQGIHPTWYPDAVVTCACGNTWTTGSTKKEIHTDVCNKCHPFFTGEQRIVDTAGQVERFMKRISAKEQIAAQQPTPEDKRAKKEKRRERRMPQAPAELPVAEVVHAPAQPPMVEPRAQEPATPREMTPPVEVEETAPATDAENVRANTPENVEILPPGEIGNVASVDRVIEPTELTGPAAQQQPEPDEAPRGTERTFEGGTVEVTDHVTDIEMPEEKKPRTRTPRKAGEKPRGPRKSGGEKSQAEEAPKTEE